MKLSKLAWAAIVISILGIPVAAHANLIQDGSFETPVIGFAWYEDYGVNTGDPNYGGLQFDSSWAIAPNNVDIVSDLTSTPQASNGNQYLDLVGTGSTGGISQAFSTKVGQTYTLSFEYGNNPWSTSTASATVSVGSLSSPANQTASVTHNTSNTSDIFWTLFTETFVANSTSTTLSFLNTVGGGNGGILLDDISVTATPLPSAFSMLLIGLAGLGLVAYRGRRKGVASFAAA
jgi:hypothetical protein